MTEYKKNYNKLLRELDSLSFEFLKHEKIDDLLNVLERLEKLGCEMFGHEWEYDQCGYWQHKYCLNCNESKYPNLAKKRCGDLDKEMGELTEDEYLEKQ